MRIHRDGFGFVTPADGSADVYIPSDALGGAVSGDRVVTEVRRGKRGKGPEGRIRDVTQRNLQILVGLVRGSPRQLTLAPFGEHLPYPVFIDPPIPEGLGEKGDSVVSLRINWAQSSSRQIRGQIHAVLGRLSDPRVDSKIVIARSELPPSFTDSVLAEAEKVSADIPISEIARRVDLREIPFVTIDGADARDHDDAVALSDKNELWVAIADVGFYVHPESELDREAAARGNSYYFPDCVLPMLPERLSNQICSLRPDEDRLVLAAKIQLNDGKITKASLCEAIIRSRARLTYEGVDRAFTKGHPEDFSGDLFPMLREMRSIAERTYKRRMSEGGIDFDLSETKVVLDSHGEVVQMARRTRTPAQQVIEEFMLAANRVVATILEEAGHPVVYRSHENPAEQKLADFVALLRANGCEVDFDPEKSDPSELQKVLSRIPDTTRRRVLSYFALRSMPQAVYSTSNAGHFGLGFSHYAHFTSPIRRYADLVIHRSVRRYLQKDPPKDTVLFPSAYETLENLSMHVSHQERVAQKAEREVRTLKSIRFLEKRLGMNFKGVIVGMVPRGIFVELVDHAVEGFVHSTKLSDDHYDFFELELMFKGRRKGKKYRLGDTVTIRVDDVSIPHFRIEFSFVSGASGPTKQFITSPKVRTGE